MAYSLPQHERAKCCRNSSELTNKDAKCDKSDHDIGALRDKTQHRTSSFSSSVEIYQSKLNSKLKQDSNLRDGKQVSDKTSNSRVNILRSEIARLREEMLSKISTLEHEMYDQMEEGKVVSANDKCIQTEPYYGINNTNQVDMHTQTTSSQNLLESSILSKLDWKLEIMKKDILDKLNEVVNNLKTERSIGTYVTSTWHPGTTEYRTSVVTAPPNKHKDGHPTVACTSNYMSHCTGIDTQVTAPDSIYKSDSDSRVSTEIKRKFEPSATNPYSKNPVINYTITSCKSPTTTCGQPTHCEIPAAVYSNFDQYSQTAREELARHLVDKLFPYDDLENANVRGVKGKRLLDPGKIQTIRDSIFLTYPVRNNENEEYLWKFICDKINAKCRGVTRTLKRKSAGDFLGYRPSADYTSPISSANINLPSKYERESIELERCTFVTTSKTTGSVRNQTPLSSESDSSSQDINMFPMYGTTSNVTAESNLTEKHCSSRPDDKLSKTPIQEEVALDYEIKQRTSHSTPGENLVTRMVREKEAEVNIKVIDEDENEDDVNDSKYQEGMSEQKFHSISFFNSSLGSDDSLEICDKIAERFSKHLQTSGDGVSEQKRIQASREEFTRTLVEAMFTRSTLAHSNVTGARGKYMLNPVKISKVRETVFSKFPAENSEAEETIWKILATKINTKCRGVKRLMKRKGIPAECIKKRYDSVAENTNKQKRLDVKDDNFYPDSYDDERQVEH